MKAEAYIQQSIINQSPYALKEGQSSKRSVNEGTKPTNTADDKEVSDKVTVNSKKDSLQEQKIQQIVQRLKAIEEKVKAHESAHKSAGGQFAGSVSYTYTSGPDGKRYITGGEVQIQIVEGKTPDETIRNMEIVRRAALAPSDPSPQDRAVAAQATQIEQKARQEKAKLSAEEQREKNSEDTQVNSIKTDTKNIENGNGQDKKSSEDDTIKRDNSRVINEYKKSRGLFKGSELSIFA